MRFIIIICLSFLSFSAFGQTYKQYVKAADKSMNAKDYYSAMKYYQNALEIKPDVPEVHYKCGKAAMDFFAYTIAEKHFERAMDLSSKGQFPLLSLYLAEVKQTLGQYKEAAEFYTMYFDAGVGDEMNMEKADMGRDACKWAAKQERNLEIKTTLLDRVINSKFSEFAGSWSDGELVYSSLKFKDESVPQDRRISKVLSTMDVEERGRTVKIKGAPKEVSIANATFNDKEGLMFFTVCNFITAVDLQCDIYYAKYDGKRWLAEKLDETINKEGYTQTQPAWSNHKDWKGLFFSSDRPEGKGGMDIWFAKHRGSDTFDEPINISTINTPFNDITPSVDNSLEEAKLYFSSDGYVGFGRYDVYQTEFDGLKWSNPENMGIPVNSGYNDVYFWRNTEMDKALVSSNRPESSSMLKGEPACCNDLYAIDFPKEEKKTKPEPEIIVEQELKPKPAPTPKPTPSSKPISKPKPTPTPKPIPTPVPTPKPTPKPVPVPVTPTPITRPVTVPVKTTLVTLESLLPLKVYFDNDEPDKRTYKTRTIKSYSKSYNEYILRESVFYDKYVEGLPAEMRAEALAKLNQFFNDDVRKGYSDLQTVSYMILSRLESGKNITIEIKGYTSPRAQSTYNQNLAQRRTSSLLNHFNEFLGGSFLPFIQSGQLKLVELPIGESTAPANVSDSLTDEKNSIYSPIASKERRAEIVAVKVE